MSEQQEREATTPHCPCCTGHKEVTMNFRKTVGEYWYKCHGCGCEWYEPSRWAGEKKQERASQPPACAAAVDECEHDCRDLMDVCRLNGGFRGEMIVSHYFAALRAKLGVKS